MSIKEIKADYDEMFTELDDKNNKLKRIIKDQQMEITKLKYILQSKMISNIFQIHRIIQIIRELSMKSVDYYSNNDNMGYIFNCFKCQYVYIALYSYST